MKTPLIGIIPSLDDSSKYSLLNHYCIAVSHADGIPLALPYEAFESEETASRVIDVIDGLLLSGGGDPDPALYNQLPTPQIGRILRARDDAEITAIRLARERHVPILGICRGLQVLNVAFGGDLYQDIPSQKPSDICHKQECPRCCPSHPVKVVCQGVLMDCGKRLELKGEHFRQGGASSVVPFDIMVNSLHHQAIRNIAPGFVCTAVSPDGIIEAIESIEGDFMVGVQWHPEAMVEEDDFSMEIFRSFVGSCRG